MHVSARARNMEPSATLAVSAKAKSLKREGKPVVSFGAGEPDFNSPPSAIRYAEEAMRGGQTHYTPGAGIPELREAVCAYYKDRFGLEYKPADVVIGAGAKPLLYEALGCLIDPGDEVIVFTPAWVSYVEQIRFFDGKAVLVDTSNNSFIPRIEDARRAVTNRTRAMIINTPNNPTGGLFPREGIARVCEACPGIVLADEAYIEFGGEGASCEGLLDTYDNLAVLHTMSKAFQMAGVRLGYVLAGVVDV